MLYVYRQSASAGARELAEALEGRRYRGLNFPITTKVRPGDTVICWGERLDPISGVTILNGAPIQNKFTDAVKLKAAKVPTIEVSQSRPAAAPVTDPAVTAYSETQHTVEEFLNTQFNRTSPAYRDGVRDLTSSLTRLHQMLLAPPPAPVQLGTWLPRLNNHVGGNDLLNVPAAPEYWSKKEDIVREYRVHSFNQKSIRAGMKTPREGIAQHAWIRSWDGGWKISYDGVTAKNTHRDLAHSAVTALGLQFGAVDIGEKADGSLLVLEVNRAPGLEGGTVEAYAKAIERWLEAQ